MHADLEENENEVIDDVIVSTESWPNNMEDIEHKNPFIVVEIRDKFEGNHIDDALQAKCN